MATDTGASTFQASGTTLVVRPIVVTDVDRLFRLFGRLSPETVHFRFFSPVQSPSRVALLRLATVDHHQREALVALAGDEIVAVARYDATSPTRAEVAIVVEDLWQRHGVGLHLSRQLATLARSSGFEELTASMLPDNRAVLSLAHKLAPTAKVHWAGGAYEVAVPLAAAH